MSTENKTEEVAAQHEMIGNVAVESRDYTRTTHPDAQWFPEAGLGLFIHWGLSSVLGKCDLSWGMINGERGKKEANLKVHGLPAVGVRMTPNEYWEQARHFNPDRYDPNKWLAAAKKAGMEYCVLTTKHHEGFAMWPSDFGDFSTKNYMGGRDLVGEYVQACRNNGLKVGFYYSPPDWRWERHHMSFNYGGRKPDLGMDHEPIQLPVLSEEEQQKYDDEFNAYVRGQVTELLTRYGKIDIIWFDGNLPQKADTISIDEIRALQPGILVNPRGHGYGDYKTPECRFPQQRFDQRDWWELCYVYSDGAWGYLNHECYKPNGWLLWELGKVRSWDGNFLPNVGPDGHGELPHAYYQRMEELAQWMQHSGEAIKGVTGGPWPEQCNVPVTRNDSAWYLHVHWVWDETVELTDVDEPAAVTCLRTGDALDYTYENRTLSLVFPSRLKTILTDIVKVVW